MRLFEVIFWGSRGNRDAEDTIYLVRAVDFRAAIEVVRHNALSSNHHGDSSPLAHVVHEIGVDSSPHANRTQILRGPYFAFAYNYGWRAWHRRMEGSSSTDEWEEVFDRGE